MDTRYRVEQKLAVGGFGAVYRATDTVIGRQVALKILHRELAGDTSVVARFRREIAALAKLKSTHTLTIYDVGETDDTLYFVMELLRGESLHEVFERTGPLAWRRLAHIARGVCSSLREAHAFGIVHRDLKPANIFLEKHGVDVDHVKVLDFGIAKILASSDLENRDLTRHGQMVGTFDYMAPEQMIGGACTSKSDMFTLGVVLYEMLTGGRPYGSAQGPAQMLMALMQHTPVPLTGVPPGLSRVIMKCLSREAKNRPDVDQLDEVLESVLADDGAFSDADEPTLIVAQSPRPLAARQPRATQPRGSKDAASLSGGYESVSAAVARSRDVMPLVIVPRDVPFAPTLQQPGQIARGSEATIARDIELALATTVSSEVDADAFIAKGTDAPRRASLTRLPRMPALAVGFQPSAPVPTSKTRLAAGTSPIANESEALAIKLRTAFDAAARPGMPGLAITLPQARASSVLMLVRYLTIAACLFGLGFLGALAIWSL